MCKRGIERDILSENRENKNLNVGLDEMMGDGIDTSDIVIYVIAAICIMMLIKWVKKCWNRRQERMLRQMQPVQIQMQPVHQPMQQIQQLPALAGPVMQQPYRNQFRPASISGPEDIEDNVGK